jgi:hypothetical protein
MLAIELVEPTLIDQSNKQEQKLQHTASISNHKNIKTS